MNSDLDDYAYPAMMAEKALKNFYNAMINGRQDKAWDCAIEAGQHVAQLLTFLKTHYGTTKSKDD